MSKSPGLLSLSKRARSLSTMMLVALLIAGCGGRDARPVTVHQYGDDDRSCQAIEQELTYIEEDVNRLIPESKKAGKNTFLALGAVLIIVPGFWDFTPFYMDFSDAEKTEINAYRQRYNHLLIIAEEKNCGLGKREIPEFEPEPTKTADEQAPFGGR